MPYESKSIEDMTFHGGCTGVIVDGPHVIMYIEDDKMFEQMRKNV